MGAQISCHVYDATCPYHIPYIIDTGSDFYPCAVCARVMRLCPSVGIYVCVCHQICVCVSSKKHACLRLTARNSDTPGISYTLPGNPQESRNLSPNTRIHVRIQESKSESKNPLPNPRIHAESKNPLPNPRIHYRIQESTTESKNPRPNPRLHYESII